MLAFHMRCELGNLIGVCSNSAGAEIQFQGSLKDPHANTVSVYDSHFRRVWLICRASILEFGIGKLKMLG